MTSVKEASQSLQNQEPEPTAWLIAVCSFGASGRMYSYLLHPSLGVEPGDKCLVDGPRNESAKWVTCEDVVPYAQQPFRLKLVQGRVRPADLDAWQKEADRNGL